MNWFDTILVFLMLLGALLGVRSGLLWQVARIVIFLGAIYACVHYHGHAAQFLSDNFDNLSPDTTGLLAYVVTFLGVCLTGFLVTWFLEGFLQAAKLKPLDRVLGGLFGLLKTGLILGGVLTGVVLYGSESTREKVASSHLAPWLLDGAQMVLTAIPEKIKSDLDAAMEKLKKKKEAEEPTDPNAPKPKPPTWGPLAR
jgi:membrane protein required for colicin V production